MGPRFNGVEDLDHAELLEHVVLASMGPRFNGVEDSPDVSRPARNPLWLQWGHALMAWKTVPAVSKLPSSRELQWGHALMAWKTLERSVPISRTDVLQWGHALMAWKTRPARAGRDAQHGFNGATL